MNTRSLALVLMLLAGCGTSSGNQAASLAADVVSAALSGPSRPETPAAWSMDNARCGVFRDHRTACPALRNCSALFGKGQIQMTVNVCVDDTGDLEAIKWCNYGSSWCRASAFPSCDIAQRWPCDDFELVVCEDESQRHRILRSRVDQETGRCSYDLATLYADPSLGKLRYSVPPSVAAASASSLRDTRPLLSGKGCR